MNTKGKKQVMCLGRVLEETHSSGKHKNVALKKQFFNGFLTQKGAATTFFFDITSFLYQN
jgi:hypothetical protein